MVQQYAGHRVCTYFCLFFHTTEHEELGSLSMSFGKTGHILYILYIYWFQLLICEDLLLFLFVSEETDYLLVMI